MRKRICLPDICLPKRQMVRASLITLIVLGLDQLTKWFILYRTTVPIEQPAEITSFFNLVLVWNYGISFGIGNDGTIEGRWLFITLAVGICMVLLYMLLTTTSRMKAYTIALVLGGAVGNIIDRVRYGAVVDFIDIHLAGFHWPAFNIADSAICIGVVLLCWHSMIDPNESKKPDAP